MGKAKGAYTPEQIAIIHKMVIDYTPEQRAAIGKPASSKQSQSEKRPGPQVSRAMAILIELYPPTGIPPVKLQVAYAEVNRVITDRNKLLPEARKERPIERDSVRRAILFLKERNTS
jgi:hypothetical protein